MRDAKRWVIGLLAGVMIALIGVALLFYLTIVRPLRDSFEGRDAASARVEMLADAPDALILSSFVTGDVPRLLTGPALERHREALWYSGTADAGSVIGAVLFGLMGLPPVTEIGTAFQGGAAQTGFRCVTLACQRWIEAGEGDWGLGGLRGLGEALGPEVTWQSQSFSDHAAYLAAHAAAAADPLRWFAREGAEVPEDADSGIRLVVLALPSEILAEPPNLDMPKADPARLAELQDMATRLIDDSGGAVQAILGAEPMPIWAMKDGRTLHDGSGTVALPGVAFRSPTLRLDVPRTEVAAVLARFEALALGPADLSALEPALAAVFAERGLDGSCLPGCGGYGVQFQERAEANIGPAPFWTLELWQLPPG